MNETRYNATVQEQQTLSNPKAVGPDIDRLKDKFKEGSIPLQTDFSELIDIADIGRKACGQAPQQNGPGEGLKLDDSGTLSLKIGTFSNKDFSPLILKDDVLSVDLGSGLTNETNGICVGQGNGITVDTSNVAVKQGNGISVTGTGVAVKAYNGINVDVNGVAVKAYNGINVASTGVAVKAYNGIDVTSSGVAVKVSANKGLSVDSTGVAVKVKANGGITVDTNGVAIDPNKVLPAGMIVMFSGSTAPTGWAFCDGGTYNGTKVPDLRNRFIACGNTMTETGGISSNKLSGTKDSKTYSVTMNSVKTNLSVTVNSTTLTEAQLPKHFHYNGMRYNSDRGNLYTWKSLGTTIDADKLRNSLTAVVIKEKGATYEFKTSTVGSGSGHNHTASVSETAHSHSASITTPYYLLAFIIKL
ncbi:Phage Tail Collar Domain protein [Photorhabdus australis subsp. thailandensis]|uniref:Phage Tail Collar Domain protein n=1 Tax=Photorhabdus australis subsp. thailandensis TaxID=2805096 RepID=A0A1C0U3H7_9GAMM|nr:tail fiber protein [Photorhabdus australis]OCQ52490.1 Phage Tail Collar Domain protein [Photorhabdus australis subsp. thailandensis]